MNRKITFFCSVQKRCTSLIESNYGYTLDISSCQEEIIQQEITYEVNIYESTDLDFNLCLYILFVFGPQQIYLRRNSLWSL